MSSPFPENRLPQPTGAADSIGFSECGYPPAMAAIYSACAPEANACTNAIHDACDAVREGEPPRVSTHPRSAAHAAARRPGVGEWCRYPNDIAEGILPQDYLGVTRKFDHPTDRGAEAKIGETLREARSGDGPRDSTTVAAVMRLDHP